MIKADTYLSAGIAVVALTIIFLIAYVQGLRDESNLISTPGIPTQDAVLTSFATSTIIGSVDEVFAVLLNYKDYSWCADAKYEWNETTVDGVPLTGSRGTLQVSIYELWIAEKFHALSVKFKICFQCNWHRLQTA